MRLPMLPRERMLFLHMLMHPTPHQPPPLPEGPKELTWHHASTNADAIPGLYSYAPGTRDSTPRGTSPASHQSRTGRRNKTTDRVLEVSEERLGATLGKVLAHDDAEELHLFRVRRHRVCPSGSVRGPWTKRGGRTGGDDPASLAEGSGDGEFWARDEDESEGKEGNGPS